MQGGIGKKPGEVEEAASVTYNLPTPPRSTGDSGESSTPFEEETP
jgi:hypothetical protein